MHCSENLLVMPKDYEEYTFPNIKVLICANMKLTWADVLKLSKIFPNVEEFRVPSNNITDIQIPNGNMFKHLKLLDLENNPIGHWTLINNLGNLPQLEQLIVEDCNLEDIRFNAEEKMLKQFCNLSKLVLNRNNIKDASFNHDHDMVLIINEHLLQWNSIQELNRLQNLEDLRFLKNPLLETENYNTCVQFIVARIANLKVKIKNCFHSF